MQNTESNLLIPLKPHCFHTCAFKISNLLTYQVSHTVYSVLRGLVVLVLKSFDCGVVHF